MKLALHDTQFKWMFRCPDCGQFTTGMTVTHPWRIYCLKCKMELQNPSHPEYYPKVILPDSDQKEGK